MADEVKKPKKSSKLLKWLVVSNILSVAASAVTVLSWVGLRPAPLVETRIYAQKAPVEAAARKVAEAAPPGEHDAKPELAFGWSPPTNDESIAVADRTRTTHFDDTPAGKAVLDSSDDVFLWRAVRMALNLPPNKYPNVNQNPVGCCVGCGWKHGLDVAQAVQITQEGLPNELRLIAVESIYGGSKIQVGQGRIRGDGSSGDWANKAAKQYGMLAMQAYPEANVDLTTFSPARARQWGNSGIPKALLDDAAEHRATNTALVKTIADVDKALRQGYPIAVCSDVGFEGMRRDAQGFIRRSGTWGHCMMFCGIRGGERPGVFCMNSWGDQAHTGPSYPEDMPVCGFWIDMNTVGQMVAQMDSYAIAAVDGFPARKIHWFIGGQREDRSVLFGGRFGWRLLMRGGRAL
jgi:hypothetical protein